MSQLPMDPARFNADVVRNLLGSSAGENRSFEVQFPVKVGGPGAFLSGDGVISFTLCVWKRLNIFCDSQASQRPSTSRCGA